MGYYAVRDYQIPLPYDNDNDDDDDDDEHDEHFQSSRHSGYDQA